MVERLAAQAARALVEAGASDPAFAVRGPAPALIERIKDRYRFHVHVRSVRSALVRAALAHARAGRRIGRTRVEDPRARRRGPGRHVLKDGVALRGCSGGTGRAAPPNACCDSRWISR